MTYDWNLDSIRIPSVYHARSESIEGVAWNSKLNELIFWEAIVTPRGYSITVTTPLTGRKTMWEGPTFNMLLEVSAAVRRH